MVNILGPELLQIADSAAREKGIDRDEVQRWFRSLHATPTAANRSAPILSVIMQQAEALGVSSRRRQPLQGHQALPAEALRAFPVSGGIPPPRHGAGPA